MGKLSKISLSIVVFFSLFIVVYFLNINDCKADAGWLTGWSYRKEISISGTHVSSSLNYFPLLVKLSDDANVGVNVSDTVNGSDIRFTDSNGKLLPYERESFLVGSGKATGVFWVRVPTINANPSLTTIYMYYGNNTADTDWTIATSSVANCTSLTNAECVWNENGVGNYKSVWHLKETSSQQLDSTLNNNDSISISVATQGSASGKIDGADSLNGTVNNFINIGDHTSLQFTTDFTFEAWVDISDSALTNENEILMYDNKLGPNYTGAYVWGTDYSGTKKMSLTFENGTISGDDKKIGSSILTTGWHQVAVTHSGGRTQFYLDGVSDGVSQLQSNPQYGSSPFHGMVIGQFNDGLGSWSGNYYNGLIDEVRTSNTSRSAAWIKFEYCNDTIDTTNCDSTGNYPNEIAFLVQESVPNQTTTSVVTNSFSISAPLCHDTVPVGMSYLFQINPTLNSAKLYFTTAKSNVTGYAIYYGRTLSANDYSTIVNYSGPKWIFDTDIGFLKPNTTYYFKVQPVNGCNAGVVSNTLKTKTAGSNFSYRQSVVQKELPWVEAPATPALKRTPSPTSLPTNFSKHCFLFWCW